MGSFLVKTRDFHCGCCRGAEAQRGLNYSAEEMRSALDPVSQSWTRAGVSGVIAVVVLGLGGSATGKWSMSAPIVESGTFDVFWDTISFAVNGALPECA